MSTDEPLFPGYDPPQTVVRREDMSPDQRRTARQQQDVVNGRHPLTGGPLHPEASTRRTPSSGRKDPFTCGSCVHREPGGSRSFPKCVLPDPTTGRPSRITGGPATDVRAWWPACPAYEPRT